MPNKNDINEMKTKKIMMQAMPGLSKEQINYAYMTFCKYIGYSSSKRPSSGEFFKRLSDLSDNDIRALPYCPDLIAMILIKSRNYAMTIVQQNHTNKG